MKKILTLFFASLLFSQDHSLNLNLDLMKNNQLLFFQGLRKTLRLSPDELRLYDDLLLYKQNKEENKYRNLTILILTSTNPNLDNFNAKVENDLRILANKGIDFQSAFVLQGFPKNPKDMSKFIFKVAGFKNNPEEIQKHIIALAKEEGIKPEDYIKTKAKEANMSLEDYGKKFYFDYTGMKEMPTQKSVFKIIPRLFKQYEITKVPAYFIGECNEIDDTDFDLNECDFDFYATGDIHIETLFKFASLKNPKKYNPIYFKFITPKDKK